MNKGEQSERVKRLTSYVKGLKSNLNGMELYTKYRKDIEEVTPQEAFEGFIV